MRSYSIKTYRSKIVRTRVRRVKLREITTRRFKKFISRLRLTAKAANGVGIAVPQVGVSQRVALIMVGPTKFRPKLLRRQERLLVNPVILSRSKNVRTDWEGCLSLPGRRVLVRRATRVRVRYYDGSGCLCTATFRGFEARVVQHEIDHLNGVLCTDRAVRA